MTEREARARAEALFLVQPSEGAVAILRRQTAGHAGESLDELFATFEREREPLRALVEKRDHNAAFCVIGPLVSTALAMLGRCLAESCIEEAERAVGFAEPSQS